MTDLFSGGLPAERKPIRPLSDEDFAEYEDGERRIPDWRIAELLGFTYERNIRVLIERHAAALTTRGKLLQSATVLGRRGPAAEVYLLNRKQALFIIAQSGAPNAGALVWLMVELTDAWFDGRLKATDAETEATLEAATAKVINATPELFALLFEQIALLGGVGDRVSSVQRTALEIQERLGDFVKRRAAPVRNQDIYDQVVIDFYLGRCPCCQRSDRIIIRDGHHTKFYHLDHATDNAYKNGLHEMWPVCGLCNGKLRAEPHYRIEKMDNFRVFQNNVQEHIGRRLI